MRFKATIDNIALCALVFAVVAIGAVSTIALVASERLIAINEAVFHNHRIVSSLESIRFHTLSMDLDEHSYVISGAERDLGAFRTGVVEIEAELKYLESRRTENTALSTEFDALKDATSALVTRVRAVVAARRTQGFPAAQAMVKTDADEQARLRVLGITHRMLVKTRSTQDGLALEQGLYGDKVRRLILALISSSAFILIFLYGSLRRLNKEQRALQSKIEHQATHDSLTGLLNRRAVMDHIASRLRDAEAQAALGGFALLLLDLDGFKAVNDTRGHDVGDELLRQVAKRAHVTLRESDYLARLGGDEFLIVIPQVSDRETAARIGQKLLDAMAAPYTIPQSEPAIDFITASIGASLFPLDARNQDGLMKSADLALYEAKRAGRNRVRFNDVEMQPKP